MAERDANLDSFLGRWSRRKVRARVDGPAAVPDDAASEAAPDFAYADAGHKPGRMNTDAPVDHVETDADGLEVELAGQSGEMVTAEETEKADADEAETRPLSEEDFADVDFDALDFDSDYTRFMGANVPEKIRNKALRKLWVSNPVLANIDGLDDYCEDFSDAVWCVPDMKTDYKVGRGFLSDKEVAEWDALGAAETEVLEDGVEKLPPPEAAIAPEAPDKADVAALIEAADGDGDGSRQEVAAAEAGEFTGVAELAAPNVRFLVARVDGKAVACGALVLGNEDWAEIKRLWVDPDWRRKSIGRQMLAGIEAAARERDVAVLRLHSGVMQDAAIKLYRSAGFSEAQAFGSYEAGPLSLFFEKPLA